MSGQQFPFFNQVSVAKPEPFSAARPVAAPECRFASSSLARAWCSRSSRCAPSVRVKASASIPSSVAKSATAGRSIARGKSWRSRSTRAWRTGRRSPSEGREIRYLPVDYVNLSIERLGQICTLKLRVFRVFLFSMFLTNVQVCELVVTYSMFSKVWKRSQF